MKIIVFKFTLIFFFLINFLHAKSDFFSEGVKLYKKEKFKEAQFKFEQEIVFNPKSSPNAGTGVMAIAMKLSFVL